MRYLKTYKIFESSKRWKEEDIQEVFEPYIDWVVVHDIKDMALEYTDDGFYFDMDIYYRTNDLKKSMSVFDRQTEQTDIIIYKIRYSAADNKGTWQTSGIFDRATEGPYQLEPIDKDSFVFNMYLFDSESDFSEEKTAELMNRIKIAYPGIKLMVDYTN